MKDCLVFPFNEEPFVIQVEDFLMSVKVRASGGDYEDRRIGKFSVTSSGKSTDYLYAHGYDIAPPRSEIKAAIEKRSPQPL